MSKLETREEEHGGKRVVVVKQIKTPEELERDDVLARLAALEEAMKQLKPGWKPPEPPAGHKRK